MPMYDRQCRACGRRFEVFRRMAESDSIVCEGCGSADLIKKVGTRRALVGLGDEAGHGRIYPYFDPNLKMRIHNAQHHKQVMKEQNLFHITPEDVQAAGRAVRAREQQIEENERRDREEFRRSSSYREYRRMVDRGAYTDDLPAHARERVRKQLEDY